MLPPVRLAQLGWVLAVMLQVGFTVALATVTEQVAVQPVVVLVTVTVYVPAVNPVIMSVVALLLHRYVTPLAVADAVPFGDAQLVTSVLEQVTLGLVVLFVIVAIHVFIQLFAVFVTVTV
jgi:hypothetical protein